MVNSTGAAGVMCAEGNWTQFSFGGSSLRANTPGQLMYSFTPSSGIPFGNGSVLCPAGPYCRLPVMASDSSGVMTATYNNGGPLGGSCSLLVGSTIYVSAYYRDSTGGGWPPIFNFASAWKITL